MQIHNLASTDRIDISLLKERIEQMSISDDEFLKELLTSDGLKRPGRNYKAGQLRIYRGRVASLIRPKDLSEISYPPPEKVKEPGRANSVRESIFYSCIGLPNTLPETRVEPGQYIIISEWQNTKDLLVQEIGFTNSETRDNALNLFLFEMFTTNNEKFYPYTAQIAKFLLMSDLISGISYPSIIANNQSPNIAIKLKHIDSHLQFINASLYIVDKVIRNQEYHITEIDFATLEGKTSLSWKGRRRQWSTKEGYLKMTYTGCGWNASDINGDKVEPE